MLQGHQEETAAVKGQVNEGQVFGIALQQGLLQQHRYNGKDHRDNGGGHVPPQHIVAPHLVMLVDILGDEGEDRLRKEEVEHQADPVEGVGAPIQGQLGQEIHRQPDKHALVEGGAEEDNQQVGEKPFVLKVGQGEHEDGNGDLVPDGAKGIAEEAEGNENKDAKPHRGGIAVKEDGVQAQADQGDAGGVHHLGGAKEGDDILQEAVAHLDAVNIFRGEDKGQPALADLVEVIQIGLVINPHGDCAGHRKGKHGDAGDNEKNQIVAPGRVQFAKEKAQRRCGQRQDEIGGHTLQRLSV